MMLNRQIFSRAATALLITGGAVVLAVAPAEAAGYRGGGGFHGGGFHGGGYGGFRGGYGGFRGGYGYRGYGGFGYRGYGCCYGGFYGYGYGDALFGAALLGTAAVIAADQPYYEPYPVPAYPAYPPPAYAPPPSADYDNAPPPAPPQGAGASTDPVGQCTRAAVGEAAARGDSGRVTRIDRVDGHANGAKVTGTLEVRRISHNGETENARFTCTADYGQVTSFRFG